MVYRVDSNIILTMKHILLINALVEILGGFILIFNPHFLLSNPSPELQGVVISKLYGITIFGFGIVSYLLIKTLNLQPCTSKYFVDYSFALCHWIIHVRCFPAIVDTLCRSYDHTYRISRNLCIDISKKQSKI